jgi:ribosomal protein L27
VLKTSAVNAVSEGSDSSVRRLSKKRSTGRIVATVAIAMAVGAAPLRPPKIDVDAQMG